jgi:hypothetical protein
MPVSTAWMSEIAKIVNCLTLVFFIGATKKRKKQSPPFAMIVLFGE